MDGAAIPYCGPAPTAQTLWSSWNFDPFLLVAFAVLVAFLTLTGRTRLATSMRDWRAQAAWALLAIAFISPLCAASTALFSARVAHHVIMIALAAPLLALAFPLKQKFAGLPISLAFAVHTILVWVWHAPSPYQWALSSHGAYWLMEATLMGSAVLMWQTILAPRDNPGAAFSALLGSVIQMGMLGALLTFAGRPMFVPHLATTEAFGITALADQQLAGILMWVPACLPYLAAAVMLAHHHLSRQRAHA